MVLRFDGCSGKEHRDLASKSLMRVTSATTPGVALTIRSRGLPLARSRAPGPVRHGLKKRLTPDACFRRGGSGAYAHMLH